MLFRSNGILSVKAKDKATSKEQSVRIEASSGLSKEDVERMKHDAESHASEDKRKKELAEARNIADTLIYATEKALRDAGDKVPKDIRDDIEKKKTELAEALKGEDVPRIQSATQAFSAASQKIGEFLYKQTPPNTGGDAKAGEGQEPREVEHEEIKDDTNENKSGS